MHQAPGDYPPGYAQGQNQGGLGALGSILGSVLAEANKVIEIHSSIYRNLLVFTTLEQKF